MRSVCYVNEMRSMNNNCESAFYSFGFVVFYGCVLPVWLFVLSCLFVSLVLSPLF
jgi:hypothetical protein